MWAAQAGEALPSKQAFKQQQPESPQPPAAAPPPRPPLTQNDGGEDGGDPPEDVGIAADVFGRMGYLDGLTASVDAALASTELQSELSKIPLTEKAALFHVQRLNPQLMDDEHVLQFLWAENFNAAVSKASTQSLRLILPPAFSATRSYDAVIFVTFVVFTHNAECRQEACPILE